MTKCPLCNGTGIIPNAIKEEKAKNVSIPYRYGGIKISRRPFFIAYNLFFAVWNDHIPVY